MKCREIQRWPLSRYCNYYKNINLAKKIERDEEGSEHCPILTLSGFQESVKRIFTFTFISYISYNNKQTESQLFLQYLFPDLVYLKH